MNQVLPSRGLTDWKLISERSERPQSRAHNYNHRVVCIALLPSRLLLPFPLSVILLLCLYQYFSPHCDAFY